ncbi:MAG: hypothetical protein ACRYHA_16175 [Janthinobacterium lividum]
MFVIESSLQTVLNLHAERALARPVTWIAGLGFVFGRTGNDKTLRELSSAKRFPCRSLLSLHQSGITAGVTARCSLHAMHVPHADTGQR